MAKLFFVISVMLLVMSASFVRSSPDFSTKTKESMASDEDNDLREDEDVMPSNDEDGMMNDSDLMSDEDASPSERAFIRQFTTSRFAYPGFGLGYGGLGYGGLGYGGLGYGGLGGFGYGLGLGNFGYGLGLRGLGYGGLYFDEEGADSANNGTETIEIEHQPIDNTDNTMTDSTLSTTDNENFIDLRIPKHVLSKLIRLYGMNPLDLEKEDMVTVVLKVASKDLRRAFHSRRRHMHRRRRAGTRMFLIGPISKTDLQGKRATRKMSF